MKFILPRLIGLTIIAGVGALLLSMIFKVLVCAVIIGTIAHFAARKFGRKQQQMKGLNPGGPFGRMPGARYSPFGQAPMPAYAAQRSSGIIPIN